MSIICNHLFCFIDPFISQKKQTVTNDNEHCKQISVFVPATEWCHFCSLYNQLPGGMMLPQQRHCSIMHQLIPCCLVPSQTAAGTNTRQVLSVRGAGSVECLVHDCLVISLVFDCKTHVTCTDSRSVCCLMSWSWLLLNCGISQCIQFYNE